MRACVQRALGGMHGGGTGLTSDGASGVSSLGSGFRSIAAILHWHSQSVAPRLMTSQTNGSAVPSSNPFVLLPRRPYIHCVS